MATQAFKNNAASVFASTTAGILPVGGLSFTVTTGGGAKFPTVSGGDYFYVTLFEKDGSDVEENYEVVKCTGVSGDTIAISERDIDSLVGVAGGRAYPTVGGRTVYVQMRVTAGTLDNFSQRTATETLSNKTFSTPVLIPDGSAAAPAIAFADDTDTGVYSSAANKVAVSLGGVKKAEFSGSDLLMDSAAVATPSSISLINPSKQMYLYSGSTVSSPSISVNSGSPYCSITFNYGQIAVQSLGGSGSTPTYSFSLDTNTGIYSPGTDQLGFSTGGTSQMTIDASGLVTIASGQIKFPAIQNASADANTLDDYREVTATLTATGMTTAPTGTATFVKTGRMVTMEVPYITGTSNSTSFTLTGIPAEVRPTTTRYVTVVTQDNGGAWGVSAGTISSAGVLTLYKDINQSAFTASGGKSVGGYIASYII